MNARIARLEQAARALGEATGALGRRAREAVREDGGLHEAMADEVLSVTLARYTLDALEACSATDLEGEVVHLSLAASVSTAPLRAIALTLLRGARRVLVRPSRRQPRFARVVLEALALGELSLTEARFTEDADRVIAYGSDETLSSLLGELPTGVAFEGRGHGFGLELVGADAPLEGAAEAIARDVALHDQRGCLSPQCVVTLGDPEGLALAVHRALTALEARLPRGPLDVGEAASVMQWQGATAARATRFFRGRGHAVAALEAPAVLGSPGARNLAVVGVEREDEVRALLAPHARHLTCVGVAGGVSLGAIPEGACPRVVVAGAMQDPPLDGYEDPRPPGWSRRARG